MPVSFDLNFRRALWSEAAAQPALTAAVRQADVVFAGVEEAAIVAGTSDPLDAALALEALGPRQVLIKLGAAGCLARIDGVTHELPAPVVPVHDTVGAGDAFVAGYLAELIAGAAVERGWRPRSPPAPGRSRCPATGRACPTAARSTCSSRSSRWSADHVRS